MDLMQLLCSSLVKQCKKTSQYGKFLLFFSLAASQAGRTVILGAAWRYSSAPLPLPDFCHMISPWLPNHTAALVRQLKILQFLISLQCSMPYSSPLICVSFLACLRSFSKAVLFLLSAVSLWLSIWLSISTVTVKTFNFWYLRLFPLNPRILKVFLFW